MAVSALGPVGFIQENVVLRNLSVLAALVALALAFVMRPHGASAPTQYQQGSIAPSWSASLTDKKFFAGIQADYARLDADVASVVTYGFCATKPGRERLISIVGANLREMEKARDEYFDQKRVEHGLPPGTTLNYDGTSWVSTIASPKESP